MTPERVFDSYLVLQYQNGDKKALELLVKRHHSKFCRHANWYVKDKEASKDIAQDSWKVIIQKLILLRDPNCFISWSLRIVTRKSLDYVKRKKRKREQMKIPNVVDGSTDNIDKGALINFMKRAIDQLPQSQQIVLRLFYTQEYSIKEIAEILDISTGTVKSRLFHAREKLKTKLK